MHILKIIHGYPPDYNAGSEVYSHSVCTELAKTNIVSVLTREENPYARDFSISKRASDTNPNLEIYLINNPHGKDGYRHEGMDNAFASLVEQLKPDIAYIGHLNHLSTGFVDVLYKKQVPIVFILHDFWLMCPRGQFLTRSIGKGNNFTLCNKQDDRTCACDCYEVYFSGQANCRESDICAWQEWVHNRMQEMKSIVSKVNRFIAPSQYLRRRFIDDFGISQDKITYLDYGFPRERLCALRKERKCNEFTFGYIGTHIPAKGVDLLIAAFLQLNRPSRLKIFGRHNGQSTNALKKLAEPAGDRIEFCGEYANGEIVQQVFSNVDAIVVPSIWTENSPLVIHEAQECRVPVITADCGGMAEYVHDKVNGLLFRHRDVSSLATVMQWTIDHPGEARRIGARGYVFSEDGHVPSISEHCERLMEIFGNELRK